MPAAAQTDLITGFISFIFTLLILSYLVGDNPAFRLTVHIFVGVSAGYIAVMVFHQVIVDKLFLPLVTGTSLERLLLVFPLLLSLLLLGKASSQFEWLGRPVIALLVGVGTASAIGGAILGTLFPQILSVISLFDVRSSPNLGSVAGNLITGVFVLLGTVVSLVYFQFTVFGKNKNAGKRDFLTRFAALAGQVFIVVTLGAIFSGVLAAALTALVDRIQSLLLFVDQIVTRIIG
jgi:hypothetical protein